MVDRGCVGMRSELWQKVIQIFTRAELMISEGATRLCHTNTTNRSDAYYNQIIINDKRAVNRDGIWLMQKTLIR